MRRILAASLLLAPALAGCAQPDAQAPDVVATFYPLEFLAERIGGENLTVESVVRGNVEPHDYEPTPADVVRIRGAKLLVLQGAGFEGWVETAREQAGEQATVVAAEGIELAPNPDEDEAAEMPSDPHTWLDPVLYASMARNVEKGLSAAFPEHAPSFAARLDRLLDDLATLDGEYRVGLATCEARTIIANHAAYGYLASRYGFTVVAIHGLEPEDEPDPQTIADVVEAARAINATIIYFEELVTPRMAEIVAEEVGAQTRVLSPIEGIAASEAAEGADYLTLMRENLVNLREGMRCT